jgi:hypothetical protein
MKRLRPASMANLERHRASEQGWSPTSTGKCRPQTPLFASRSGSSTLFECVCVVRMLSTLMMCVRRTRPIVRSTTGQELCHPQIPANVRTSLRSNASVRFSATISAHRRTCLLPAERPPVSNLLTSCELFGNTWTVHGGTNRAEDAARWAIRVRLKTGPK